MKQRGLFFALGLLALLPSLCQAADPVVSKVRVEQRQDGSKLADITYDVTDADTDTLWRVKVGVSPDSGKTWAEISQVNGDVGKRIPVGRGKRIVWDLGAEFPNRTGKGYLARVVAEDSPPVPEGMVLIPGGCFQMGDAFGEGISNEQPVHRVCVDAFFMDQHEVTNREYRRYDPGHTSEEYDGLSLNGDNQPVVYVSWWDAIKYCNWRSRQEGLEVVYDESTGAADFAKNGYRLPTEAEWEYAARGGLEGKRYVWGDGSPPAGAGNVADETAQRQWSDRSIFEGYDDGYAVTAPVESFAPNGYALYDMAGNVWEWCHDWYGYYSRSPQNNPSGAETGSLRVLRGGSWALFSFYLRVAYRYGYDPTSHSGYDFGFRCARPSR